MAEYRHYERDGVEVWEYVPSAALGFRPVYTLRDVSAIDCGVARPGELQLSGDGLANLRDFLNKLDL